MTLVINSAYPIHYSAIDLLGLRDIQLNIIPNNSPYVLATRGNPHVVIHPLSNMLKGEYPTIKFCGPGCKFPNYNYEPEIGFSELGAPIDTRPILEKMVFINTVGDTAFVKYLESLNIKLEIYGKRCYSLFYYGPLNCNSYDLYKQAKWIAVDCEEEALRALFMTKVNKSNGQIVISNFDYNGCMNFRKKDMAQRMSPPTDSYIESKNWNNIFNNLFKEIGVGNG